MPQRLALATLVVRDYDEAIAFYVDTLGFALLEDIYQPEQDKRWVTVGPKGGGCALVLGQAGDEDQAGRIGDQTGGRVAFFLETDDFWRDYAAYKAKGVHFTRQPVDAPYGTVAVFADLYGTLWDLIERKPAPAAPNSEK
ncbi:MAG: VOC family protein [Pseudomonadota bacterium]